MKAKIKTIQTFEITTLKVKAGVRYWEDATVNGKEDTEGELIPCRDGDYWCPVIDIDRGIITNWQQGVEADIHYKVCDDGTYELIDKDGDSVLTKEGYVPDILCPEEDGYGDYIIMQVNKDGSINSWKADLTDLLEEEED